MCAISHISHFKIRRVSQPCAHVPVDALCSILSAQANINLRCRLWMWIITGQRDFYFACGIFVWAIPRPWSSRSSNIDVRQTSITSHFFLTGIIICSFNNNSLERWANAKAINIVVSAQFFATLISERLVVLGRCLFVAVTKFQGKFGRLRWIKQV